MEVTRHTGLLFDVLDSAGGMGSGWISEVLLLVTGFCVSVGLVGLALRSLGCLMCLCGRRNRGMVVLVSYFSLLIVKYYHLTRGC